MNRICMCIALCLVSILLFSISARAEVRASDSGETPQDLGIFIDGTSFFSNTDDAYVQLEEDGNVFNMRTYFSATYCSGTTYVIKDSDKVMDVIRNGSAYYKKVESLGGQTSILSYTDLNGDCTYAPGSPGMLIEAIRVESYTPSFTLPVTLPLVPSYQAYATGPAGEAGYDCWDLDQNGICTLLDEDSNDDGDCDVNDCRYQP